jgi:hypothetical protein
MPKVKITNKKGLVQSTGTGPTTLAAGHKKTVVLSGGGATVLTPANSGATCVFDTAAASTFTLPSPELGMYFTFISSITATGDHEIIGDTDTYGFLGGVAMVNTTADQTNAFSAAVDGENDYITMNGTTTGGIAGSIVHVAAILDSGAVRAWAVHGTLIGSGNTVTPFADA